LEIDGDEQGFTTPTQIVERFTNTLLFNIFHILAPLSPSKRRIFFFNTPTEIVGHFTNTFLKHILPFYTPHLQKEGKKSFSDTPT